MRPVIHCHDLSVFSRYRVRHGKLPDGRIWCYLQDFCIALSCLLLVSFDGYNLPDSVGNFIVRWGVETMAPSSLSVFLPIKAKYDVFASTSRYLMMKLLKSFP